MKIISHTDTYLALQARDRVTYKMGSIFGIVFLAIGSILIYLDRAAQGQMFQVGIMLEISAAILVVGSALFSVIEVNYQFDRHLQSFVLTERYRLRTKKIVRTLGDIAVIEVVDKESFDYSFSTLSIVMKSGECIQAAEVLNTPRDRETFEVLAAEIRSFIYAENNFPSD